MIQMDALPRQTPAEERLRRIVSDDHPLCKDEVVYMLEYFKKKVAEGDPRLQNLPQPRLMRNVHSFAEIAMLLLHRRPAGDTEADRLKALMKEALYGLI